MWCRTLNTYLQFMWRIKLYQEVEETCLSSLVCGPSVWTNNHLYRRPAKPDYQYIIYVRQVSLLLRLWKSVSKHISWVFFWRFFCYSGSLSIQGVKKIAIGKLRLCRIIWNCYFPKLGKMVAILCIASASIWVFSKWQNFRLFKSPCSSFEIETWAFQVDFWMITQPWCLDVLHEQSEVLEPSLIYTCLESVVFLGSVCTSHPPLDIINLHVL